LLKNVGSNWTLNGLQILAFLVLARYILDALGLDLRGVWGALIALLGPLQLLVLGVPMASVRFMSGHVAKGDLAAANRVLATCFAVMLAMGAIALALSVPLVYGFERGLLENPDWTITSEQASDARTACIVMALHTAAGFALMLPYSVFAAYQDFVARNVIMAAGLVLRLALTIGLLELDATLTMLAVVQILVAVAEFVAAFLVSRKRHEGIALSLSGVDWSLLRPIFTFSGFAMLLNIGALLAFRLNALVIGAYIDEAAITVYEYGNIIFEPFLNLVLAIGMVVMPLATSLEAQGKLADLVPILRKWTKIASCLVFLVGLWLLVVGPAFLDFWIGPKYLPEMGRVLQILVVSFLVFLPVRGVALPILMGMGQQAKPALALLIMGAVNLGLSIALVGPYGLDGVAFATAVPNVVFAIYVFTVAVRTIGADGGVIAWDGFVRPLLGAGVAAGLLAAWNVAWPVAGFFPLLSSGLVYLAAFAVIQVVYVWRGDPDVDLLARFRSRLATRAKA
jgi:O-antigen/teichoic acid export membrane protein